MPSKLAEKLTPEEYRQIVNSPIAIPVNEELLCQIKDPAKGPALAKRMIGHAT